MRLLASALTLLLIVPLAGVATAEDGGSTATTWDQALALSREHGKPILIDFFTEW